MHGSPAGSADVPEESALYGLSTTIANQRLIGEVEAIVFKFHENVRTVTLRSRCSFLQTHEGIVPLCCCAFLAFVAAYTLDWTAFAELALVLPFHSVAWYISFRLPRVEQLRAIAKVRECVQHFIASEDAFTQSTRGDAGGAAGHPEMVPPSSFCVSVLRDRMWRQVPYNMVVEGDVFKLRDGEIFPCRAERLAVRPPHGALPTGEVFKEGTSFAQSFAGAGRSAGSATAPPAVSSFRALSTACLPVVEKFLRTASKSSSSSGRMDTVFFELAALVRSRLKQFSAAAFLATTVAFAAWLARPAVADQSVAWQLHRLLLPLRLIICVLPLMPVILLQITDVWGNARIQSLFEWHAGLADEERGKSGDHLMSEEASPGSGEIDASRVPLWRQLRELLDILRQGLDGPSNLMHTLNSTTVVCFCDKEGLLTDTCTTIDEVCLCSSDAAVGAAGARAQSSGPGPVSPAQTFKDDDPSAADGSPHHAAADTQEIDEAQSHSSNFQIVVLDVQPEPAADCGLRFEDSEWRNLLPMLKPLGLAMAVSRQPRELTHTDDDLALYNISVNDLMWGMREGDGAVMHDCLCNVSQLIGFKDDVLAAFHDVKFCMELCRPLKEPARSASVPSQHSHGTSASAGAGSGAGDSRVGPSARLQLAFRAALSPGEPRGSAENSPPPSRNESEEVNSPKRDEEQQARERSAAGRGATNFSQTLMTWFVQDTRDCSLQMFCKAKPKRLLPKCAYYFNGSKVVPLTDEDKQSLMRLVLQWKASGLVAVAYSYRPLTTQADLDIPAQLTKHNLFCATEGPYNTHEIVEVGHEVGAALVKGHQAADGVAELQTEQVLLGMAGVKLCASVQMSSYADALQAAGIRFQVYSREGEKRTRTLGSQLGLETGWNCLISLEPKIVEVTNMMGQVVLPSGIANIRKHTKEVDNVPLLVSLYSKASPWRAQQMINILQENGECVTCVGSALQPNFGTFLEANISVSVLVGAVPQCRRCLGRREPRPGELNGSDCDLLVSSMVSRAEFQLSADLSSLPCALQARHSYSNGEQRTLGVLYNAIKEARRCVDCILMVLIHYICGAVQLAFIVAFEAIFCLPPPLEGTHLMAILFVLLPVISFALLFNAASPQLMKELPLKKQDEKTLAQPGRLMCLYALRSIPSALVVIAAFIHDLHRMVHWQLQEARRLGSWQGQLAEKCDGFSWLWWFTGRWPSCAAAMSRSSSTGENWGHYMGPWDTDTRSVREASCALVHAQQWGALLFVIYEVTLAFTFLDRYDSLRTRGPTSNKVLCTVAAITLLVHVLVGFVVAFFTCGRSWHEVLVPPWEEWVLYVGLWPLIAVGVSECTKRRDRRYHLHLQKTLRVLFNTRLGMWSPK